MSVDAYLMLFVCVDKISDNQEQRISDWFKNLF